MRRGNPDAGAIAMIVALVGVAVIAAWVMANWEAIVFWTSTAFVVALCGLAVYLVVKGGGVRR